MQLIIQNIIRFVLLVLIQVFFLDSIQFLGYIRPFIYILFILSLPIRLPQWAQLLLAFILGLIVDMFSNTMGMHTFAVVFTAFVRNLVMSIFVVPGDISKQTPSFSSFGTVAYVKYAAVLVLVHHSVLFLTEAFTFMHIGMLFAKIILSSAVTLLIVLATKSIFNFDK